MKTTRRIGKLRKRDGKGVSRREAREVIAKGEWLREVRHRGMYPLDAPGMPLPGPNFVRHAQSLGDEETKEEKIKVDDPTKKSGKRTETRYAIGGVLERLYLKALRKPGFSIPIELRGGRTKDVTFVPGHIWGQHIQQYKDSMLSPDIDATGTDGPHKADVMVVGKMPGREEEDQLRNFIGPSGEVLIRLLSLLRVKGSPRWYTTNLLKYRPPDGTTNVRAAWLKDCMPLLHQELRIVRPKYILCLGADASKALLGSRFGVGYMDGRVMELKYNVGIKPGDEETHTALVMTVIHPAQVAREQSLERQLERGLSRFNLLQQGIRFDKEEKGVLHDVITDLDELEQYLAEIEGDPKKKDSVIAMDAEWHGEHAVNKNAYLRTIQLSWRPKHCICVKLRSQGGKLAFFDSDGEPALDQAIDRLREFIKGKRGKFRKKRVVGHFFNADLEHLVEAGLDIEDEFQVPLYDLDLRKCDSRRKKLYKKLGFKRTVPAWVRTRYEGGADTGLMAHAVEESARYALEALLMRYTTVPRYDVWLHDWREAYCKEHGLKAGALEGYGECPDYILCPTPEERAKHGTLNYACYDADGTLRLYYELNKLLDYDHDGNCCREAFWESQIAAPAVLEIHRNGIPVDRPRIDALTKSFMAARASQERRVKRWAQWPEFNIRSVQHVKEFLFGEDLNGKVTPDGSTIRIRPAKGETCGFCDGTGKKDGKSKSKYGCKACRGTGKSPGGRSLYLEPLITTSKPPKLWSDVVSWGKEDQFSPSTNKMVLSVLAQENEEFDKQVNWIRDYRFLDQVLKTVLRPPATDDEGNWLYESDSEGGGTENLIYEAGLASQVCDDGRVRTHMYQTKETGRWSSARPNLQNFAKQRDPDYERLLGDEYKHKLRSILMASPGHVLLEADYVGAELYGMAIMSGDRLMIEHATRNQLPEEDPLFYDIHSNVAVMAFNLKCEPTKTGLASIKKKHLRIVAKSVIFGIAYGRGAKAIALAAKEQGVRITVDEAQRVIDTIFAMYPGLIPFFDECKNRSQGIVVRSDGSIGRDPSQRWLCHCFGRFRRFPYVDDFALQGEFERQAMNFPIQGMIASAVSRAIAYLKDYKRQVGDPDLFRILLQIHDAILLEVPYENVEFVAQEVLPWAMCKMVPIYPSTLGGKPTGAGPYHLGIEADVMEHWGEKLSVEVAKERGMPTGTWAGDGVVVNFAA